MSGLNVRFTFEAGQLNVLLGKLDKISDRRAQGAAMHELGLALERNIALLTPVKTGGAKGNVHLKSWGPHEAVVRATLDYWPTLEEGSRAHVIRPVHARVLAWGSRSQGGTVFAKMVNHPGTKGQHPFRQGTEKTAPLVVPVLARHLGLGG